MRCVITIYILASLLFISCTNEIQQKEHVGADKACTIVGKIIVSDNLSLIPISKAEGEPSKYMLTLTDKQGAVISELPVQGHWVENEETGYIERMRLLTSPCYYMEDIDHDGQEELLLKDRRHNGTMWNAACLHIFSLKGGEIRYLGNYEYISHLPIEDQFLVRHWDIETGKVMVYQKQELDSKDSLLFGSFQLSIKNDTLVVTDKQIDGG